VFGSILFNFLELTEFFSTFPRIAYLLSYPPFLTPVQPYLHLLHSPYKCQCETGRGKSKMAVSKLELLKSQQRNSNRHTYAFVVQPSNETSNNDVRPNRNKPEVGRSRWQTPNWHCLYLSFQHARVHCLRQ